MPNIETPEEFLIRIRDRYEDCFTMDWEDAEKEVVARDAAIRKECAERAQRALILLQAMVDMMEKQKLSHCVQDIFELTATWDDAECDGYCLYEEAKELLEDAAIMGE